MERGEPKRGAADEIDASWLNAVLLRAGVECDIADLAVQPVGNGMYSSTLRLTPSYRHAAPGTPRSLIGKFPSGSAQTRAQAAQRNTYLREVEFYRRLADSTNVSLPRCWHAEIDAQSHDFALLLEDMAPARPGDFRTGISLAEAEVAMAEGARLHASHWGAEGLARWPWMSRRIPDDARFAAAWQQFRLRQANRLRPEWIALGDAVSGRFSQFVALYDGPQCLAHNDFRPENMMFGTAAGAPVVTVLDWQSFGIGAGATDLAYFLAAALPVDQRRVAEDALLVTYHRHLVGAGVSGYGLDNLRLHYAQAGYALFFTAFYCAATLGSTEQGEEMFLDMLTKGAAHMLDHRAAWDR